MDLDDVLARDHVLDVEQTFDTDELDREVWLPYHLPQWSSSAAAAARYRLRDGHLELRVDADQPPWCPEFDGDTRVSSLQTGVFSGPVGSRIGQHRFHPDAVVREEQPPRRLLTPTFGAVELRARAEVDATSMAALWMIGFEDQPDRSAEICVCEIFGRNAGPEGARIGMGVHPFGDPTLADDFAEVSLPIDVTEFHEYAAVWGPDGVTFHVDGVAVRTVTQAPQYPMQFMLGVYQFGDDPHGRFPKRFVVDAFRTYRRRD
ncbi:glycoside hydrolase family 16 protein [Egicoccus sp. AB-alg2]|uniref:glycoside hydrolase family 16 protein n=1 Tax=Egicoccus sp. AB-alg2 TaxID=3242693 RepID=UPI00359EB819